MIRRPRRVVPATIVAVLLLALCVAVTVSLVQRLAGSRQFLSYDTVARWLYDARWDQTVVLAVGVIVAALGVLLLLVAVWPGTPTVIPLADSDALRSGVTRRGLRTALRRTARSVDGVDSARIRLRRRSVKVFAQSDRTGYDGMADVVCAALTQRIREIGTPSVRRVRAKLRGSTTGEA